MTDPGRDRPTNQTNQVSDVALIEHTEAFGQTQRRPIPTQDAMGHRVKRPASTRRAAAGPRSAPPGGSISRRPGD